MPTPQTRPTAPFEGVWSLIPDSCVYDPGQPVPSSAVYTLLPSGEGLWFHVRWRVASDPVQQASFSSALDGEAELVAAAGPSLAATLVTCLEDGVLVSTVVAEGKAIHVTRRSIVDSDREGEGEGEGEGGIMEVLQEQRGPGGPVRSKARYAKTEVKQVLLYRRDLKMRKGKIVAQCAHASTAVFFRRGQRDRVDQLSVPLDGPSAAWMRGRFTKICLSVEDEVQLLAAHRAAEDAGLPLALITDAGKTEFHGVPTKTALAIGPAAVPEIDAITGPEGRVPAKLA